MGSPLDFLTGIGTSVGSLIGGLGATISGVGSGFVKNIYTAPVTGGGTPYLSPSVAPSSYGQGPSAPGGSIWIGQYQPPAAARPASLLGTTPADMMRASVGNLFQGGIQGVTNLPGQVWNAATGAATGAAQAVLGGAYQAGQAAGTFLGQSPVGPALRAVIPMAGAGAQQAAGLVGRGPSANPLTTLTSLANPFTVPLAIAGMAAPVVAGALGFGAPDTRTVSASGTAQTPVMQGYIMETTPGGGARQIGTITPGAPQVIPGGAIPVDLTGKFKDVNINLPPDQRTYTTWGTYNAPTVAQFARPTYGLAGGLEAGVPTRDELIKAGYRPSTADAMISQWKGSSWYGRPDVEHVFTQGGGYIISEGGQEEASSGLAYKDADLTRLQKAGQIGPAPDLTGWTYTPSKETGTITSDITGPGAGSVLEIRGQPSAGAQVSQDMKPITAKAFQYQGISGGAANQQAGGFDILKTPVLGTVLKSVLPTIGLTTAVTGSVLKSVLPSVLPVASLTAPVTGNAGGGSAIPLVGDAVKGAGDIVRGGLNTLENLGSASPQLTPGQQAKEDQIRQQATSSGLFFAPIYGGAQIASQRIAAGTAGWRASAEAGGEKLLGPVGKIIGGFGAESAGALGQLFMGSANILPAVEWAVRNPGKVVEFTGPGLMKEATDFLATAQKDPVKAAGQIGGMLLLGHVINTGGEAISNLDLGGISSGTRAGAGVSTTGDAPINSLTQLKSKAPDFARTLSQMPEVKAILEGKGIKSLGDEGIPEFTPEKMAEFQKGMEKLSKLSQEPSTESVPGQVKVNGKPLSPWEQKIYQTKMGLLSRESGATFEEGSDVPLTEGNARRWTSVNVPTYTVKFGQTSIHTHTPLGTALSYLREMGQGNVEIPAMEGASAPSFEDLQAWASTARRAPGAVTEFKILGPRDVFTLKLTGEDGVLPPGFVKDVYLRHMDLRAQGFSYDDAIVQAMKDVSKKATDYNSFTVDQSPITVTPYPPSTGPIAAGTVIMDRTNPTSQAAMNAATAKSVNFAPVTKLATSQVLNRTPVFGSVLRPVLGTFTAVMSESMETPATLEEALGIKPYATATARVMGFRATEQFMARRQAAGTGRIWAARHYPSARSVGYPSVYRAWASVRTGGYPGLSRDTTSVRYQTGIRAGGYPGLSRDVTSVRYLPVVRMGGYPGLSRGAVVTGTPVAAKARAYPAARKVSPKIYAGVLRMSPGIYAGVLRTNPGLISTGRYSRANPPASIKGKQRTMTRTGMFK